MKAFDVALIERPNDEGLERSEVMDLYDMVGGEQVIPIEISNAGSAICQPKYTVNTIVKREISSTFAIAFNANLATSRIAVITAIYTIFLTYECVFIIIFHRYTSGISALDNTIIVINQNGCE